MKTNNTYLHFVAYKLLGRWDIKSFLTTQYSSQYRMVALGEYIREESQKYTISDKDTMYGILGVNNQTGIFDAYEESGAKINQKYKRMETGWIAYNPYRVNVGSIGIKREAHKYEYISPAYVVFSCKEGLLPEYLFMLMKTPTFNKIIRENTTGSVRQNLSYDNLSTIQIPLPSLAEQQALVDAYNHNLQQTTDLERQAENGEKEIDTRIREYLQFSISMPCCKKGLNMVHYKETSRWDPSFFFSKKQINSSYPLAFVEQCVLNFMTDASGKSLRRETSKTPAKEYTYIGMENVEKNKGTLTSPPLVKGNAIKSQTIAVPNGYMIYGKLRPYLNKYWLNVTKTPNIVCSSEFFVFDIKETLNKLYFEYILASSIVQEQILNVTSGARMPRINEDVFYNLSIPLPPLDIQQQIVDEVQTQRAKIAEYKTTAITLRQEAVNQFEQAIFN